MAQDLASSLSCKLAYVPRLTTGFVKLLASSGSHCTKWADEQHRPAGFESRLVPDLPLPFIPTLIGLRAFDLVSSRVWWEALANIGHSCYSDTKIFYFLVQFSLLSSHNVERKISSKGLEINLPLSLSHEYTHAFSRFLPKINFSLWISKHNYLNINSSSPSSYRAGSTDIPDPLSPLLPIVHRPR